MMHWISSKLQTSYPKETLKKDEQANHRLETAQMFTN